MFHCSRRGYNELGTTPQSGKEPDMAVFPLLPWVNRIKSQWSARRWAQTPTVRPDLGVLAQMDPACLPQFVRESALAMKYLHLLGMLDWSRFPDRPDQRFAPDLPPLPHAALAAAYLVKVDQHIVHMADLHECLVANPALVWVLGFPLVSSQAFSWGFDVSVSLPTHRHLSRLLRTIPNTSLQFLLDDTVRLIAAELAVELPDGERFGDCISMDTKHIIAWVKENNPKAYIKGRRYDKTQPPTGDPDCRLGCKRKSNQGKRQEAVETTPTPLSYPIPAAHLKIAEYYWGYGSGLVATKVADWGEFVLAELTQPFDQPDVSYFEPLMAQVERRLGFRPRFGAFDAAFDAFYVYEYFNDAAGFAAVPFVQRGRHGERRFSPDGVPLCAADLPMAPQYRFRCNTTLIPHERVHYVCPLRYPNITAEACPVQHEKWAKDGCATTIAASAGARLRYQIDRQSQTYRDVYKQRTATERLNSQAVELGIERPKLRNGQSIANHNTLTYVLINLHALQRIRLYKAAQSQGPTA